MSTSEEGTPADKTVFVEDVPSARAVNMGHLEKERFLERPKKGNEDMRALHDFGNMLGLF